MSKDNVAQRKKQKIYFKNDDMDFNFLWALEYQYAGGSELGECYHAASSIKENDAVSWAKAWEDEARRLVALAERSLGEGHRVSSRGMYMRAFTYYKWSSMGLRFNDPKFREAWANGRACFKKAAAMMDKPPEFITLSYGGGILPGYFIPATNGKAGPTLIILIGGEGWAEDCYFFAGRAGLERGYNLLAVEFQINPGVRLINEKQLGLDVDATTRAIVDYAVSRQDVDKEHIAVIGFSSGGYFAMRAASNDKRIKACILDSPINDLYSLFVSEFPQALQKAPAFITDSLVRVASFNSPMSVIDIEKICWMFGVDKVSGLLGLCKDIGSLDATKVTCPTLCLAGESEGEAFMRQALEVYQSLGTQNKAMHVFTEEEGADAHCQLNNLGRMHEVVYDWLDEVFEIK